ncbi:SDR family oxidoreductase [Parvibaculaceae bacterium PLY_AMNH_Bact1]|nr:SDR family oxidoreductase [Parvibaculaceae bacterium PLY_AMNH_Bact1]
MSKKRRAVVLGAYGFIGSACVRALMGADYKVIGIGRSESAARQSAMDIDWSIRDISTTTVDEWIECFADTDIVVNASGALQDGLKDNLYKIHEQAVASIATALAGSQTKLIHISAAGASITAETEFMRSKARGDAIIQSSDLNWCILRPTLVLGAQAYGGTALLRACAATPLVGFKCFESAQVQTISLDELAGAVVTVANGLVASRQTYDLTEAGRQSFWLLVKSVRKWLGFPSWKTIIPLPKPALSLSVVVADGLGWLGWRAPLRKNAVRELSRGINGDPSAWLAAGGARFSSLAQTLDGLPQTSQERAFARLYLLLPMSVFTLSAFWILSGVIGFWSFESAKSILTERGFSETWAMGSVAVGSLLDIFLGGLLLVRRWSARAAAGMILLSFAYMAGAALWAPDLWADPLGAMVKVVPGLLPALMILMLLEDR